ncbi:threonylcarbamoyl-AMP synthase [candidate division WOR-3 bacterium]|nr:threonylcarbamoyl-AMP synthase [candidate division WOR-3 bacterium]
MSKQEKKTEIFLFPTDTVPGIGCFLSRVCVAKLRTIKKRPPDKPFPLLLSDEKEIRNWVEEVPPIYEKLKKYLPGGITLIFKGKKSLPEGVLSNEGKVGIRIPNHKELRDFIRKNKMPLISTSANISGEHTPKDLNEVALSADKIINGKVGSGNPSTVLDISNNSLILKRKGAISIMEIENTTGQEVKLGKNIDFNVLFVCTANLCRSPMAEIHLKHLTEDLNRVNIRSAGTHAMPIIDIYEHSKSVLEENNLNSKHISRLLTKPLIEWADLILVMENIHKKYITFLSPENKDKIAFFGTFKSNKKEHTITDPAGKDLEACRKTFELIKEANKRVEKYLKNKF